MPEPPSSLQRVQVGGCVQGEMLDAGDSGSVLHHNRHVLTDVSLALLQDTNWYYPPPLPRRLHRYLQNAHHASRA